jgi:hypothetical protein
LIFFPQTYLGERATQKMMQHEGGYNGPVQI